MTAKQRHRKIIDIVAKYVAKKCRGYFVELGTKQGTCSVIMAKYLHKGFLFDTWKGPPSYCDLDINKNNKKRLVRRIRRSRSTEEACINNLVKNNVKNSCKMIKGDICETLPCFFAEKDIEFSMIHIDTDVCKPAKIGMEYLWPKLELDGAIVVHDYGDEWWPGIKEVVDSFVKSNDCFFKKLKIHACLISKRNINAIL